jgi:adenylate cyclase
LSEQAGRKIAFDWDRGLVTNAVGDRTALRAQSLAVLKELYNRAGTLVSKEELIAKIWPGVAVTDDSLVQCIAELRRALRDDDHTIIKTLTKRGYIFELPHELTLKGPNGAPFFASALETIGHKHVPETNAVSEKSIAVLPFANLSADSEQDFFVDGLSEDVMLGLSNCAGLFVIGRNSAFAYQGQAADARQVAYDLGVTYVLEGSVRRAGGRLRVNAQLINGRNGGKTIWAERIDHEMQDVFASQDQLAKQIAAKVLDTLEIEGRRPSFKPKNKEAYKLSVKSRDIWAMSQVHCALALDNFQRALEIDPDNVEATFQLAVVHCCSWYHLSQPEYHRDLAKNLAAKAIEQAPFNSAVYTVAGGVEFWSGRHGSAERLLAKALELNPNNPYAHSIRGDLLMCQGKLDESLDAIAASFRIDPHGPGWFWWELGAALIHSERYDEAIKALKHPFTYNTCSKSMLAVALALTGRIDEAKQEAKLYLALNPDWCTSRDAIKRPYLVDEHRDRFIEGFRKAGLPE